MSYWGPQEDVGSLVFSSLTDCKPQEPESRKPLLIQFPSGAGLLLCGKPQQQEGCAELGGIKVLVRKGKLFLTRATVKLHSSQTPVCS